MATWGQTVVPTDATAVFPPDSVPTSNTGSDLAASAYTRATITYTDASGREVNTASPGGHITTTEYDRFGNTVRSLTAGNRELALATSGDQLTELTELGIDGLSTADRAQQLSTSSVYSSDGLRETDEYGPLHQVTLTSALTAGSGGTDLQAGTVIPVRSHTANTFDENRPTDGTATVANQITTTKSGAYVDGYPSDADVRTSTTAYDWVKGLPTTQVTDPSGLAITTTTSYDSQGRVIKTTQPKSSGTDADTTVTSYYSATGTGTCNGRPEWADQVCSTGPAGAITGGGTNPTQLPTKTVQYDWWGNQAIVAETANSVTRTTTTTYDSYDRVSTVAVSGGVGTAVPNTTTTYDTTYGTVATVATSAGTISYGYDKLGRQISYSDGVGNTTTTAYDALGRTVKTTDSAPSTTTYTYDTAKDHRGLETSRTDSVAGTFSATYDADGDLATEALPGGYTLTDTQDEAGTETSRIYTKDSDGTVVASDTADHTVQGQTVADTDSNGQTRSRSYTYDAAGRLTQADDTSADNSCTRRSYTFDSNTNRTALATSTSGVGSACTSTGATTTSYTYDTADRLQTSGTVYDAFGRTTTQASGATIGYYTNDLVRQQTSGTNRQTWTLDAAGRLRHLDHRIQLQRHLDTDRVQDQPLRRRRRQPRLDPGDSSTLTRNVQGISGDLDATTSATGSTVLQLTDIHGDTTVQLPLDTSIAPTAQSYDEYGNPEDSTPATRYGWLGGKQRSSETVTGATLMGVRLDDPTTGRFLSVDPVAGGSSNAYDYCNGDPVDRFDLDGRWWGHRTFWNAVGFLSYRSWIDSAGAASHGHYRKAWHYASGGTGSVTAGAAHSKFCSWYCRTVRHARPSMWSRFGRFGARTFGWEVSVVATGIDYWHTRGPVTSYSHHYYAPGYRYRRYYGGRVI